MITEIGSKREREREITYLSTVTVSIICDREECSFMLVVAEDRLVSARARRSITS
jgi:hypothetical protein